MSTRSKGRRNELKAKAILESLGYLVHLVDMPSRFKLEQDLFNMFDILALNKDELRWIQVTTNRLKPPAERARLASFIGPGTKELWVFKDGVKEPRIILLGK